LTESHS